MEKHMRFLMFMEAVEKSSDLQEYLAATADNAELKTQALKDIEKWYGLTEADLQASKTYFGSYFAESKVTAFRFIWF